MSQKWSYFMRILVRFVSYFVLVLNGPRNEAFFPFRSFPYREVDHLVAKFRKLAILGYFRRLKNCTEAISEHVSPRTCILMNFAKLALLSLGH